MENSILKEIVEELKDGNNGSSAGYISYDTWGGPERSNKYHQLKYHLIDNKKNGFMYGGEIFIVEFRSSNNITSMGGKPDSIAVRVLNLL